MGFSLVFIGLINVAYEYLEDNLLSGDAVKRINCFYQMGHDFRYCCVFWNALVTDETELRVVCEVNEYA